MDGPTAAARAEIDAIDRELLALLARRQGVVRALFAHKDALGLDRVDPSRERAMLADRAALGESLGLDPALAEAIFRVVLVGSRVLP